MKLRPNLAKSWRLMEKDWSWTFDRNIILLCKYLESHPMELFSAAIVILLGQLGRLGATAHGYEDPVVQKLREHLSAFPCKPSFTTSSLILQSGIVNSLYFNPALLLPL